MITTFAHIALLGIVVVTSIFWIDQLGIIAARLAQVTEVISILNVATLEYQKSREMVACAQSGNACSWFQAR